MNIVSHRLIRQLYQTLHQHPEVSGNEKDTRSILKQFLKVHTEAALYDCGNGFYAVFPGTEENTEAIAFRTDYDALPIEEYPGAAHLCGHDGHACILCSVALELEYRKPKRKVVLLFQPEEETGKGALQLCPALQREGVTEIYGMHNLPGYPLGEVYVKKGTFALASCGLEIELTGKPCHAAYPETGISPAHAVGAFLSALPEISSQERFASRTMCTVIGVHLGERAFGKTADKAKIWLTLRSERDGDLEHLRQDILRNLRNLVVDDHLEMKHQIVEPFPATVNHIAGAEKVRSCCRAKLLPEPMRWSEDFGYYLKENEGAFFGIGAGINCAPLHTDQYEFPEELLDIGPACFLSILENRPV